jgi:hypothetical protein
MLIGCLTWGSLVWNPIDLPVRGDWHKDGPFLPIEFARISQHDRITLVVLYDKPDYPACRSLWTLLDVKTTEEAAEALRSREDCKPNGISLWKKGGPEPKDVIDGRIARWATRLELDAVVWTKLGPQWMEGNRKVQRMPELEEVLAKLKDWGEPRGTYARLYLQMAPKQIDTPYRRAIFKEYGFTVLSPY